MAWNTRFYGTWKKRWEECIFCQEIEGHPCPDSTYAVPVNLYKEIYNIQWKH